MNQEWLYPHRDAELHKNRYNDVADAKSEQRFKETRLTKELLTKCPLFIVEITSEEELIEEQEAIHQQSIIRNKLLSRVYELAEEFLTEKQKVVLALYLKGIAQPSIAAILNINYTNIPHVLFGVPYKNSKGATVLMGGIIPKLKKLAYSDSTCLALAKELADTVTIVTHREIY